ncbi:putative F-box/FBD/LRR-repeat protein At1g66290 [Lactuca sativa]|uniref:putative F-box/FBD/LRR-repeat protein At1g66290 n=1 Tax=Lactuca sativa TaxID=4236 RepID=UPI001C687648|nr:putative F-box/FBD/LRR-repeat protein At1g66290 [Lactuca sativa]
MKKSEPPKTSKPADGTDFISSMPDAILLLILSRLPSTEEAIRSSILSRRWRNLWTAIPSLYLDIRHGRRYKKSEFKELVYWVLVNRSADLDCFRLYCSDQYSISTAWRWIHAAVKRNVKKLELTFYPKESTGDIEMPNCLVICPSLESLRLSLGHHGLRLPNIMGFPALRVLDLTSVDLLEDGNLVKGFSWE